MIAYMFFMLTLVVLGLTGCLVAMLLDDPNSIFGRYGIVIAGVGWVLGVLGAIGYGWFNFITIGKLP